MAGFSRRGLGERGSVSILFLLLSVVIATALLGILGLSIRWRLLVGRQVRLDRCVAEKAHRLKETLTGIERGNARLKSERIAVAAALATNPAAVPAIESVIEVEVAWQEALRARWAVEQTLWIARRGCDGGREAFFPLPRMAWVRPPPDALGPAPLEWEPGAKRELTIRLWRMPRSSGAQVYAASGSGWRMRWVPAFERERRP